MNKVIIGLLVLLVFAGGSCISIYFGVNNTVVQHEQGIEAQYKGNQVALAGYTNKIMDMVQVPDMAKDAIKEVATAAIQGRYGAEGSKAVFQMITEQNPTVDGSLYRSLMQAMESGRNSFDADQKTLLDKCRAFDVYRFGMPEKLYIDMFGLGHLSSDKLESMCTPVITEGTARDFDRKRTGPLNLRPQAVPTAPPAVPVAPAAVPAQSPKK